ncbi:MAG: hypothetical protein ACYTHM_18600 [Planctomycetota bacterium]|jgi:DNA repair exonuclease SbcCD ATPase subunit
MNGAENSSGGGPATDASPQDFLKKHVRGIPREKMRERKVYYGFKYGDLKNFINAIIRQYKGIKNPDLLAKISEIELKMQNLQNQRDQLTQELEETKAALEIAIDPEVHGELASKLETVVADKSALESRLQETEKTLTGTADEHAKRAQDLGAELGTLKADHEKAEKENTFLEEELDKLNAANRELTEKVKSLTAELDALKALEEKERLDFEKERETLRTKIGDMEKIVASSSDAQKLLEMQNEYATYKDLLKAYEQAASETVDVEVRPDPEEVAGWVQAIRERVAEDSTEARLLANLETVFNHNQSNVEELLEAMYDQQGSFRTILNLGKALTRSQHLADGIRMLNEMTKG